MKRHDCVGVRFFENINWRFFKDLNRGQVDDCSRKKRGRRAEGYLMGGEVNKLVMGEERAPWLVERESHDVPTSRAQAKAQTRVRAGMGILMNSVREGKKLRLLLACI